MGLTGNEIISYAEQFKGENSSRFTNWYGVRSTTPWCVIFVSYVLAMKNFTPFPKCAWVPTANNWCKANARWVKMAEAQAGDIVIFTWHGGGGNTGNGALDHIGFIKSRNSDGSFQTIEGNTNNSQVAERRRYPVNIQYIYRPSYGSVVSNGVTSTPITTKNNTVSSNRSYVVGRNYTINVSDGLRVRTGPGTNYRQKRRDELTPDGKRHAIRGPYACLQNGTVVTCLQISGNWMRIPSGWICCKMGNAVYVR